MFNFGKKSFLGVDIGTSTIKIVELGMKSGRPFLLNYAWMPILEKDPGSRQPNSEFFMTLLPEYLKRMVQEAKFQTKNAFVSIPSFGGILTLIDLPNISEKDMEQAIRFEAHRYIPISLDDVVLSWEVVGGGERKNNRLKAEVPAASDEKKQVLLVAASKSEIKSYEETVEKAGLALKGIEMENISMVHSLVGSDLGNFIIVDIGARVCNILYVEKGIIKINRNLDAGGLDITRTIAQSLGITDERAESMKISGQDFFTVQSEIQLPTVEIILGELSRMVALLPVGVSPTILLSGGAANLKGFKEFLAQKTGLKVVLGDPFGRVGYAKQLESILSGMKAGFSVSVGLALRGFSE